MSRKRIKQYLMLLTAVGVVAVAASGAGTFATFNAEVSNNGNTFTAGTLFLHDTNGTNTCTSEEGTANANNGSDWTDTTNGCSTLFSANVGNDTLSTTLGASASGTVSSITIASLNGLTLHAGDVLDIAESGQPGDTVVVGPNDVTSGTTVNVFSEALAGTYTTAATVTQVDTTHYATLALNNAGSLNASDIKFDVPGCTASHPQSESIGSNTVAGVYSSPNTTITLTSGSLYTVAAGQNVKVGANVYPVATTLTKGNTSLVVTGDASSEATGSILWEPTFSSTNFCSDAKLSIAETDSSFDLSGSTPAKCVSATDRSGTTPFGCQFSDASALTALNSLSPLSLVSGRSGNATTGLDASKTRYFLIGVQLPASSNNDYQNQKADFGLTWHIDAA